MNDANLKENIKEEVSDKKTKYDNVHTRKNMKIVMVIKDLNQVTLSKTTGIPQYRINHIVRGIGYPTDKEKEILFDVLGGTYNKQDLFSVT